MSVLFAHADWLLGKSLLALCAVAAVASIDLAARAEHRRTHLLFATILGTVLSIGMIEVGQLFLQPGLQENAYAAAFLLLVLALAWRLLFGPWETQTKATVLGMFLFWIALHMLWSEDPLTRTIHLIAASVALIPAGVWCLLFMKYHSERLSAVLLLFFSGMIATVPILFYDALVRHNIDLQFFLFSLKPESFNAMSQSFVNQQFTAIGNVASAVAASLLSFVIVGVIEELSKYWALNHSARQLFSSIDDVMQLGIIVAIGFSFAENIVNPVYFTAFVQDYLLHGAAPDVAGFLSNVLGRSVLTAMVHIVSTGVLSYFLGIAIFAGSQFRSDQARPAPWFIRQVHAIFRLPEESIFRTQMLLIGITIAVTLHGLFNFIVTLPELLPGNPRSIHDLVGNAAPEFLSHVPILLLPSLLYVVGGFWLLTNLFLRKANMVRRGHLVMRETYVMEEEQ